LQSSCINKEFKVQILESLVKKEKFWNHPPDFYDELERNIQKQKIYNPTILRPLQLKMATLISKLSKSEHNQKLFLYMNDFKSSEGRPLAIVEPELLLALIKPNFIKSFKSEYW
jgi:hypothetical protein